MVLRLLRHLRFLSPACSCVVASTVSPKRTLIVLFLGVLMAALDIAIVGPALPAIGEHFGVDARTYAWVFNAFVLFNLMGVPLMTKLSDGYGRRKVYSANVVVFAVGSLVVALAPSFTVLLVGRSIQGLGASGIFPVASAVVGDLFPPEKRGRALGILGAVFGLAFFIGPIFAGITLQFGWQWLFLFNLPFAAIVLTLALRTLPKSIAHTAKALDWKGIVVIGLLLASLAYGINGIDAEAFRESITSLRVWPFLILTAVLIPLFGRLERKASAPLIRLELLSNRQVLLAGLFAAGAGLSEAAFIFFPGLAVEAFGVPKSTASFMLLPLVFAVMLGSPLAGRLVDRKGSRLVILMSTVCITLGLLVLAMLPYTQTSFYAGSILIGFGLSGLLGSAVSYILLNEAAVGERTIAQGISTLFISIGQLMGGAFIGAVVASSADTLSGYQNGFFVMAVCTATLIGCAFLLKNQQAELQSATA